MLGFFKGFLSSQPVPPPLTGSIPSSASLLVAEMNRITEEAVLEWELGEAKMDEGLRMCVQQEVEKEIQRRFAPLKHVPWVGRAKASALSLTGPSSSSSLSSSAKPPPSPKTAAETFPSFYHESESPRQVSSGNVTSAKVSLVKPPLAQPSLVKTSPDSKKEITWEQITSLIVITGPQGQHGPLLRCE